MKQLGFIIMISALLFSCAALNSSNTITNSFESILKGTGIKYRYIENTQTHDYSNNWDLDGDKIKDGVLFIGNGGAHLQFNLSVRLSSQNSTETFDWIYTDNPLYESNIEKNTIFSVQDFDQDSREELYIRLNSKDISTEATNNGISAGGVVISYDTVQKKLTFKNR